ncbi:hypothetical protein B566_EDAN015234 [Ephemera danica]|nr:hypothetical protein B566_EDAN015234 [Ephemera danica]
MRGKNSTFTISSQDEEGMSSDETAIPPLPDGPEGMALFMQQLQARLDARKAQVLQKAHEAELESLAELEAIYGKEKKSSAEASERKKQLDDLLGQKTAQLKNTEKLIASRRIGALKVLVKTFDDCLGTKLKRNKETGLIDLTFFVPNSKGEKVKFPITLKDVGPGKYDVVDPSPSLMPLVEKFHQTKNITAFLCDVREFAKVFVKNNE